MRACLARACAVLLLCPCCGEKERGDDAATSALKTEKERIAGAGELIETPDQDTEDAGPGGQGGVRREGSARPPRRKAQAAEPQRPSFPRPAPGQMIAIPAGTLLAGSSPDDVLRVQYAENDLVAHEMKAFEIDALPFPNDPDRPFYKNVTLAEAEQSCLEVGKRLCTELEWEMACKGAKMWRYPTGNTYDKDHYPEENIIEPASAFGVFAMGRILEWTDSSWGEGPDQVERGVARGFAEGLDVPPDQGRRCAQRWRRMPDGSNPVLGFRCCRGEVNQAACFIEPTRPPFSVYNNMKPDRFAAVIRSIPEIKAIHDNPHMFSDADIRAVLARRESDREDLADEGVHFLWKPMRWIPRQGMELWVAVGRSNRHAFVVALHEIEDNLKYSHASSMVLWNQPLPLALAYREGHRDEIYWAPCWGCRDGGSITFDDASNEVIITHKW